MEDGTDLGYVYAWKIKTVGNTPGFLYASLLELGHWVAKGWIFYNGTSFFFFFFFFDFHRMEKIMWCCPVIFALGGKGVSVFFP